MSAFNADNYWEMLVVKLSGEINSQNTIDITLSKAAGDGSFVQYFGSHQGSFNPSDNLSLSADGTKGADGVPGAPGIDGANGKNPGRDATSYSVGGDGDPGQDGGAGGFGSNGGDGSAGGIVRVRVDANDMDLLDAIDLISVTGGKGGKHGPHGEGGKGGKGAPGGRSYTYTDVYPQTNLVLVPNGGHCHYTHGHHHHHGGGAHLETRSNIHLEQVHVRGGSKGLDGRKGITPNTHLSDGKDGAPGRVEFLVKSELCT